MAGSDELLNNTFSFWQSSTCSEDLADDLPGFQETQIESNYLRRSEMIEGPSLDQPGQVAIEDYADLDQQSLGKAGGSPGPSLNGSNSAQGQHTNYGVEVKRKGKRSIAKTGGKRAQDIKRPRGQNWEDEEKCSLLVLKLKVLWICMLPHINEITVKPSMSWSHYVSKQLGKAVKSCQGQWDSLLKSRNAIFDHESRISSGASNHVSFWQMTEHQKDVVNQERSSAKLPELPRVFQMAWYELMEMIFHIQKITIKKNQGSRKEANSIQVDAHPSTSTPTTSTLITDSAILSQGTSQGPSDDNIAFLRLSSQDSTIPPMAWISNILATRAQGSQHAEDKKLDMSNDDHLISRITPFVTKQIEDALKPHISDIQGRREDDQKHRVKILEIEEQKLALKREKMHLRNNNVLVASMGNAGSSRSQGAGVAFNAGTSSANVQHFANYQISPSGVRHQLSNVNADMCNIYGAQAGVGAHSNFQTSLPYVQYENSLDPPSGVLHQLPNADAADLCSIYSAQAGTVANSKAQTSTANLAYHGQQYANSYDLSSGVIYDQPDASADLCNIYGAQGGVGAQAGVAERSLVHAGQFSICQMPAPTQDQDFSTFLLDRTQSET